MRCSRKSKGHLSKTVLSVISLVLSLCSAVVPAIEYDLQEETPAGTVVGNVKRDSNLTMGDRLRFQMRPTVQGQQRFFALDENTGDIITARVLDRETLCPYTATCDLPFDVSVRPVQFYQVIKVVIHVVDINDNRPVFPSESVTLNVPETALPGATFVLPAAEDADSGRFGVQEYRLLSDYEALFQLVVTDQFEGTKDVRLKLTRRLDRETVDAYRLTVVAVDGGQPQRSGSVTVDLVVLDANDNSPRFARSAYEVEISEDLAPNTTLLRVLATDPDQGPNGEVRYSLADQTEAVFGQIFGVDEKTGDVFLKSSVDYEQYTTFLLTVQATDMGSRSLSAFVKVVVNVTDVNDNAPTITVNVLTDSGFAQVPENADPGTFVAHAAAKDADSGRNGQTQCFIDNRESFALESLYGSEYAITTVVALDREDRSTHELTLTCRDKGDAPLTASRTIQVRVVDENDNRPELDLPSNPFVVKIRENNRPGASVVRINATDRDEGPNGELQFHLGSVDDTPEDTFSIDPNTGNIIALKSLDYEQCIVYRFLLNISDLGAEPLSTTATVTVSVLDANDERPLFDRSWYFLTVRENQPPGTIVGTVSATDADLSPEYRRVAYGFSAPSGVFEINELTGEVKVIRRLDREEQETHRLTVTASNRGYPGMESRVNVTVVVEDENDCPPVFVHPPGGVETVELVGHSALPGATVTRLLATDCDTGSNAQLTYGINSGNVDDLFHIDPTTGVITLAKKPSSVLSSASDGDHRTPHKLVVVARDGGRPPMLCVADITVVFNHSLSTGQTLQGAGETSLGAILLEGNNVMILVGAVTGFVVVVTCVIVTAVCVRRRGIRAKRTRRSSDEISHRHCRSPSLGSRGGRGGDIPGDDRFGSFASSTVESGSMQRPLGVACSLLPPHHICDCDAMVKDDGSTFADLIPSLWSGLQQDSGIIENSDGVPVSCDSGDIPPQQLTPSSSSPSSSRRHGVARTRSCSPHACFAHRCCSHGNRCPGGGGGRGGGGGAVPLLSSHRCRVHQSPSFRQRTQIAVPYSPSEAVRMLQSSLKMSNETTAGRDHDLESLGSASTWTDSGRGPSEEEDRLRPGQGQGQGSCLKCGSNLVQNGDAISVIS